ncbi:MAG: LysE family translocator [Endozoicomonas sp.]
MFNSNPTYRSKSPWQSSYLTDLLVTLSNPKVILLYLGFIPAFVDMASLATRDIIVIALVVSLVLGTVMLAYGYAAAGARNLFQGNKAKRLMDRSAGSVMIATGTVLAMKA